MANKDFHEQMAEERKYYMGKTDKIPGSDMTVKEAREDYLKEVAKVDAADQKKRREWLESRKVKPEQRTTAVTHNTVRTDTVDATEDAVPDAVTSSPLPPVDAQPLNKTTLKKKSKAELVTMATDLGLKVVPDSQTEDQIIDAILSK